MNTDRILKQLNPEQREAVKTVDGPVLVLAGAGTGKTRVITFRIAYMLAMGIAPGKILGLTFTNKAAREMVERLEELVSPEKAQAVTLGTFHSFCVKLLRREIGALGYMPGFTIADDGDQAGLIKQAAAVLGYKKEDLAVPQIKAYIGKCKNNLRLPADASQAANNNNQIRLAQVYAQYQELLQNQNMLDFDDMLLLVYELFEKHPDVLKKYQEKYEYLLVDEYQDTNVAQFNIVQMLAGKTCNLCVVGDDDQSIYGWRGASVENILNFPKLFKDTQQVRLEQNYRSTNIILKAANSVIAKNPTRFEKRLWSAMGEGDNILAVNAGDGEEEADFIAEFISQEIHDRPELSFADFAVLYRSNYLSRQLEHSMRQHEVPYKLVGGQEFFQRKEIKDAVAYLKLLINPREDQSLLRILGLPPRGLGPKAVDLLKKQKIQKKKPFALLLGDAEVFGGLCGAASGAAKELAGCMGHFRSEFKTPGNLAMKVTQYLNEVGYLAGLQKIYRDQKDSDKRRENLDEFITAIAQFEAKQPEPPTLGDYLESYALLEENDKTDEPENDGNRITLTTIHAAKGLEYPYVFITGLEKKLFPHERAIEEGSADEELRLFYVALTRAKRRLILSYCARRMFRGQKRNQVPSEFLNLLPEESIEVFQPDDLIRPMDKKSMLSGFDNIFSSLNLD